jgi:ribosomal protein L30E
MLAICRKAGKLALGFDAAEASLGRGAALVVFTSDVSPKTKKRMQTKAARLNAVSITLPHSADDVWRATGKRVAVMAITNRGLADRVAFLAEGVAAAKTLPTEYHEEESDL